MKTNIKLAVLRMAVTLIVLLQLFWQNSYGQGKTKLPKRMIFDQIETFSLTTKKIEDLFIPNGEDSLSNLALKFTIEFCKEYIKTAALQKKQIVIERHRDTILQSFQVDGKMIGDYQWIKSEKEILKYSKKMNKVYDTLTFSTPDSNMHIIYDKTDIKRIAGYKCFKVTIVKKNSEEEETPLKAGNTIYDLYVTSQIKIPLYALFYLPIQLPGLFPLNIRTTYENLPGFVTSYKLSQIEY